MYSSFSDYNYSHKIAVKITNSIYNVQPVCNKGNSIKLFQGSMAFST